MGGTLSAEHAPRIEWHTAEVLDGDLHLRLAGEIPKGFGRRYAAVFARLGRDGEDRWGAVKVAKGEVRVRDLEEGCEADLRHQLESALLQTNSDLGAIHDEGGQAEGPSPEHQRDGRMTAAFRGFAETS